MVVNRELIHKKPRSSPRADAPKRRCVACGTEDMKPGRRYCSNECRQKLQWTLALSKGLLQTLNTRYATFSFTQDYVALDIMPTWSKSISRFVYARETGHTPALALKELILEAGTEWYAKRSNRISRSLSSQSILEAKVEQTIHPDTVKPAANRMPKLSAEQKKALKHLSIPVDALIFGDYAKEIKRAFRVMAKLHHPDTGGDGERFKEINEAHNSMSAWVESPRFQSNSALPGCWSYNGYKNRWSPPLRQ